MPVLVAPVHSTALSEPTASMTARTSSIVVSADCTSRTRSERPVPRLSSMSTRPQSASPWTCRTRSGWSHVETRSPAMPRMNTTSTGTRAYDLIGDRDVATACVAHVRQLHGRSVSDRRSALHGIAVDSSSRRAWSWVAVRSQGGQTVALLRRSSHLSNPSPPPLAQPSRSPGRSIERLLSRPALLVSASTRQRIHRALEVAEVVVAADRGRCGEVAVPERLRSRTEVCGTPKIRCEAVAHPVHHAALMALAKDGDLPAAEVDVAHAGPHGLSRR